MGAALAAHAPRVARLGLAAFVALVGCAGQRRPASEAQPAGLQWFCAQGSWSACGRTREQCPEDNARIGSRVVSPGAPPEAAACVEQATAVCYTYVAPSLGKTRYDCFRDSIECEGYRKEALRSPGEHRDLSVCDRWD
ncbi:MAG: hypothetical protein NVS3B10_12050 [Polyangiales bacterium]